MSPITDNLCHQVLSDATKRLADTPEIQKALLALVRPFTIDHSDAGQAIQGRYLCKFRQSSRSVDVWELVGLDTITQALVDERWPIRSDDQQTTELI